ncbi:MULTISPECIES: helicase-exonuclease AddAB subunit AddA [Lachnospiraceae]|uniref:ATP-dependent helicase/nuclease subunit A n=1 Tax=Faecalicatena acetigenes TaxID=2981790 RepID=A0ABT2T862_9FIRM|nr:MULTISPECIES: helicase-exonuclease AddAB subunit AddA [Lachnospiraceae]MCU6746416.1 helicase-exonuclease AddAB subunit AddA [Faecalicatena acetigenes]RGT72600.1 helicase-exonuclease AddAB subunit AddA [Ruminococcus sp. AF18-22]SCH17092.1 ATP-dependent helicase/nuclease subunit A [uncultured Clostridium sp.]
MSVKWTSQQQKVIDLKHRNILVSAAAGSGKTAVLVERIIKMLTDKEDPTDVDRLLIVTFTEAAAAEMKERIRGAIEKELNEHPENTRLQRQATLIHSAHITTIHSFCLSVIREHFHVIDLDPGFRIVEEGELKLLKQDVLDTLLEEEYVKGEQTFLEFTERYSSGRNDRKIEEIILKLYEYSLSYPQKEKWLKSCETVYEIEEDGTEAEIFQKAHQQAARYLADLLAAVRDTLQICEEADGPYMYGPALESDIEWLEAVQKEDTFAGMSAKISEIMWKRLSPKKDESVADEKKELVKKIRERVKKQIHVLKETYFYEPMETQIADMRSARPSIQVLLHLVNRFGEAFSEAKRKRNMIDFHDMEQFALSILTEEREGVLVPSVTALEYQEQFVEVMIDEYQDSNLLQEAILTSVSRVRQGAYNIFMVGDVKQSIYRFRLSRPELFMEKYDTYSTKEAEEQRIDLHKNFRSRTEVLDSVNFLFGQIMCKEMGGVAYDESAALYPGAVYEPQLDEEGHTLYQTELLLLDKKDEAIPGGDEKEKEAYVIAAKIKELIREGKVLDKQTGEYRRPKYKDIVILTRSVKGWAKEFADILMKEGIPAYCASREGYFETYEVSVLLDYLKILDNFQQDIPLTAVLTSPFGRLNARELAYIKTAYPDFTFPEAVSAWMRELDCHTKKEVEIYNLCKKLKKFFENYNMFRDMVPYTPIHELLWEIMEETGYGLFMEAAPGGGQRTANLHMLIEKAVAFEKTSYKGLFNFVRYIEQLKKYDIDYGEASIEDEQSDTVRIMSIHKSKGLEFPIVFAAGMGKKFNTQDTSGSIVIHPKWGVGIDTIDLEKRTKIPSFLKKVIQREVQIENLGEELRVLYVAMTRAKEKLVLTGSLQDADEQMKEAKHRAVLEQRNGEPLSFLTLAEAKNYLDWILPAVSWKEQETCFLLEHVTGEDFLVQGRTEEEAEGLALDVLENWDVGNVYVPEYREELIQQLAFVYPYEKEGKLKLKFTVSELKKREMAEEEDGEAVYAPKDMVPLIPEFLKEEEELKGASRGSAYHKLLELLDFSAAYDEDTLKRQIGQLQREGMLTEDMVSCIRTEDILCFLESKSAKRMSQAAKNKKLYKEQPFVLGVDAGEIYPEEETKETILVQGIIDVYFEEEDGLVVLDYKTDQVHAAEELREKYHAQLMYYAKALEQLLKKPVKEKIIYSFTLQEEIQV